MIRAAVMTGPGQPTQVRAFEPPEPEPGAVVLETLFSEVCGTDCHLRHGKLAGVPYPIIPGHVSVGRIAAMGGPLEDVDGVPFQVGEVVAFLDVHGTCGQCWFCTVAKASTRCPHRRVYGITYSADEGLLGGWAESIYLRPGVRMLHLPPEVSPEIYIAAGCGLPTAFHAVERADIRMGDTVAVQGTGPVGLASVVLSRMRGATQVIALGAPALRLDLARSFGADEVIDIGSVESGARAAAARDLTHGRGADVVIEASGNPHAVPEGLAMARDNGTYVVVGQYTDYGDIPINPHLGINKPHLDVRGCWGCDFSHLYRGIKMLARSASWVPWTDAISRRYSLDEADQAMDDVEQLRVVKAVIEPHREARPT
jgi:L-iditol 2-dehydrogenase